MADLLNSEWKWFWRKETEKADCGIFAEERPGHAYAVARCPRFLTQEQWSAVATHICVLHNADLAREHELAHNAKEAQTAKYLHPKAEERFCTCGAGHGSHEGHTEWCAWHGVEPLLEALTEAMNWFTPPNDSKPFPGKQIADALNGADEQAAPRKDQP